MSEIKGVKVAGGVYSLNDEIVRAALENLRKQLGDGSFIVGLANAVKAGAITLEMLDENLKLSASVVDDLETDDAFKPLSANQGKILKELIDIINGTGEGSTDKKITDAIAKLVDNAPENLDTLKELAEWIENHGTEAADMLVAINANAAAIANETKRATEAEGVLGIYISQVESSATQTNTDLTETKKNIASSLHASAIADVVNVTGKSDIGRTTFSVNIPAATTEKAGVMSAVDKVALENVNSVINIGEYPNIQAVWDACKQIALNNPEISIIKYSVKAGVTYNSGVVFQSYHYNDAVVTQYYLYGAGQKHECNVRHIVSDGTTDKWQPIQIFTSYKFENGTLYGYKYGESESEQNKVAIVSIPIGSAVAELIQEVTYSELVALRDNAGLVAGMKYRITDYMTTTVQRNTKSANHPFDIIVEAVSENELSELAQAIQHGGDTYFDGNDLGAWQLWYDLDNNTDKYEWADTENGKGVIYRMIDERGNDCPYDFKNIRFLNGLLRDFVYTFSYRVDGNNYDGTVDSRARTYYNIIRRCITSSDKLQRLNNIVFLSSSFSYIYYNNSFGNDCQHNSFGNSCSYNSFGNDCSYNSFGNDCHNNSFGSGCSYNSFGNSCYTNSFGNSCYTNSFGNNCHTNSFGNSCYTNSFGNNCHSNVFGNDCNSNHFGNDCSRKVVNKNKTSITLNDEFYDDGSGSLVPIKHPDLSTQPSILPYKFMGQYVYEQLIPIGLKAGSGFIPIDAKTSIHLFDMSILKVSILCKYEGKLIPMSVKGISYSTEEGVYLDTDMKINGTSITHNYNAYAHIVYTSMPEEGGYYYNSAIQKGILVKASSGIIPTGMYNGTTFLEPIEQGQEYYFDIPNDYISSEVSIGINSPSISISIIVYFSIPDIGKSGILEYDDSTKQIRLPDEIVDKAKQSLVIITIENI